MKKIVLFIFTIIVVGSITTPINSIYTQSDITIEDIEALADTEIDNTKCVSVGSVDCPKSKEKVLYYY